MKRRWKLPNIHKMVMMKRTAVFSWWNNPWNKWKNVSNIQKLEKNKIKIKTAPERIAIEKIKWIFYNWILRTKAQLQLCYFQMFIWLQNWGAIGIDLGIIGYIKKNKEDIWKQLHENTAKLEKNYLKQQIVALLRKFIEIVLWWMQT